MTKRVVNTHLLMQPIAQFTHALRVGKLIYVGAMAGTDAARRLAGDVPGRVDARAQAARMFANLATLLDLLGAGYEHLLRVKSYVADTRDVAEYCAGFNDVFGAGRPVHAVVGSHGFPLPQVAVELDALAIVDTPIERFSLDSVRAGSRYYGVARPAANVEHREPAGTEQQVRSALEQLVVMLKAAGLNTGEVVHLHVAMLDIRDAWIFENQFKAFFRPPLPAVTVVGVPLESPLHRIQIEVIAHAGGGRSIGDPGVGIMASSPAMLAGTELFVGGHVALQSDKRGEQGADAEARSAWDRIGTMLAQAGMTREHVATTNNVLTDWRDYASFNRGYGAGVAIPYPPRTTRIAELAQPSARVQIEVFANTDDSEVVVIDTKPPD